MAKDSKAPELDPRHFDPTCSVAWTNPDNSQHYVCSDGYEFDGPSRDEPKTQAAPKEPAKPAPKKK